MSSWTDRQSYLFEFRPLTEADLPLLQEWLTRPHLRQWWREDEQSLEDIREKYLPRIWGADAARPYLVFVDGEALGYIQYYDAAAGSEWWPDRPGPGVYGIDQFLSDPDLLGRGIGTTMIAHFIAMLVETLDVTEVRVDPRPDNLRAIGCYRKAGFREIGPITTPDGPAIMMVKTLSNPVSGL